MDFVISDYDLWLYVFKVNTVDPVASSLRIHTIPASTNQEEGYIRLERDGKYQYSSKHPVLGRRLLVNQRCSKYGSQEVWHDDESFSYTNLTSFDSSFVCSSLLLVYTWF